MTTQPSSSARSTVLPDGQAAADDAVLLFRGGDGAVHRFALKDAVDRVVIGRGERCDIVLGWDGEVSRAHAVFERVGDGWLVADDGLSRNGTFVNGERLSRGRRLQHGDRVQCGSTVLAFGQPSHQTRSTVLGAPRVKVTEAQGAVLRALCRPVLTGVSVMPATNRDIAHELHLAEDTVKDHLQELFRRFRLSEMKPNEKRQQLVRRARNQGLV